MTEKLKFTINDRAAVLGVPVDYPRRFFKSKEAADEFFAILTTAFAEAVEDIKAQLIAGAIKTRDERKARS